MNTEINVSKTFAKYKPCDCKCKFDGTKCKSNQWWNNDADVSVNIIIYVRKIKF